MRDVRVYDANARDGGPAQGEQSCVPAISASCRFDAAVVRGGAKHSNVNSGGATHQGINGEVEKQGDK